MTLEGEEETAQRLKNLLESLLFVADRPLEVEELKKLLGVEAVQLEVALLALAQDCQGRGVRLLRHGETVQMVTSPEATPLVEKFLGLNGQSKLSSAALETLAIIAYEQPITRARIEAIRGVNSDRVVASLIARGLVAEVGRLETAGHPALLGTTLEFLHYFGLERLEDLPPLKEPLHTEG